MSVGHPNNTVWQEAEYLGDLQLRSVQDENKSLEGSSLKISKILVNEACLLHVREIDFLFCMLVCLIKNL